jgi:hypothetical protein
LPNSASPISSRRDGSSSPGWRAKNPQNWEAHVDKTITRVIAVIDPEKLTAEQRATLEVENEKLKAQPVAVPEGRFSCIVIDPPWDMHGTGRCYNRLRLEDRHCRPA